MYSIIKELDLTGDIGTSVITHSAINRWAASIPNHPYSNLGDIINYRSIRRRPVYLVRLTTLYNTRSLSHSVVPYNGQSLPEQKYFGPEDIDVWRMKMADSGHFNPAEESFLVNGSQSTHKCSTCYGGGTLQCPTCYGAKNIKCNKCEGSGDIYCPQCNGYGKKKCTSCSGNGYIRVEKKIRYPIYARPGLSNEIQSYQERYEYTNERCSSCRGDGEFKCTNCNTKGIIVCDKCKGAGKLVCSNCKGTGSVVCHTCKGKKYMLSSYHVNKSTSNDETGTYVTFGNTFDVFPEYKACLTGFERDVIFSKVVGRASVDILPEQSYIDKKLQNLITQAAGKESSNFRIEKQKVDVEYLDTYLVDYSFQGKDYSLVIVGKENKVIPGVSPISEISEEYLKTAHDLFYCKKPVESYNMYVKAREIGAFEQQEHVASGINGCLAAIKKSHTIGAAIVTVLAAAAIIPLSYYYYFNYNLLFGYASFLKQPDFFLVRHHPWVMFIFAILFVYAGFSGTMEIMTNQIKFRSGLSARIFTAAAVAVGMAILMQGTLLLLNATGLMHITTLIAWLFTFWA